MSPEPLGTPKAGEAYRRPVQDKPFRVIWREGERDRSRAFGGPGEFAHHEARARDREGAMLIGADIRHGWVYDFDTSEWHSTYNMLGKWGQRREPTPEERERILAMGLTWDPR